MRKILIIADDLSGAADSGMACAVSGMSAVVVLQDSSSDLEADVLAIDADTRDMDSKSAANEAARVMQRYWTGKEKIVFKKMDSTLRGNVASELAALLQTLRGLKSHGNHVGAIMAPAFPANGRTTVQGYQLLNGTRLEGTEIWQRESISCTSHIPTLLKATGLSCGLVELQTIRSNDGHLRAAMTENAENFDVTVCDAETDEDLHAIANVALETGSNNLWAGSAGLAYHLPMAVQSGIASRTFSHQLTHQPWIPGPTLFVIGTASSVTREQVRVLTSRCDAVLIAVSVDDLLAGLESGNWLQPREKMREGLGKNLDIVLVPDAAPEMTTKARVISLALADLVAPFEKDFRSLVATGGETARCVLKAWGITSLRLQAEVEPGVPFSIAERRDPPLGVITKAGDFGGPETLLHCRQFLHKLNRDPSLTSSQAKEY